MLGIQAKEIFCPRCQELHIAGSDTPYWLWFTCGTHRYSIPEEQTTLGTSRYAEVKAMGLPNKVGCMNCARICSATDVQLDNLTHYICYRCGEVGAFVLEAKANAPQGVMPVLLEPMPLPERKKRSRKATQKKGKFWPIKF